MLVIFVLPSRSRPVWGAWIEMETVVQREEEIKGRAPYGARGLKLTLLLISICLSPSRPVWGAWIEICHISIGHHLQGVAPRMGRVD